MYYDMQGNPMELLTWAKLFESAERRIGQNIIGYVEVSTVWIGLDHNMSGCGPPLIFETMVFGGPHDQWQARYATLAEAEAGHAVVVAAIKAGLPPGTGEEATP